MIDTINEQRIEIVNRMREYDVPREIDLRFSSARHDVNFCDDSVSFPPLEFELEEVLDPSPTTLPFVVPSSFSVRVDEDDLCYDLGNVSTQVPDYHETFLGAPCVDVVVVEPATPNATTYVSPDHIDTPRVCHLPSLPSPSLECYSLIVIDYHDVLEGKMSDCIRSLSTFKGYDPPFDPFHDYLVDTPRKIIWTTFFDHSFVFSKAYDTILRALTIVNISFPVFSYIHHSRMDAGVYD